MTRNLREHILQTASGLFYSQGIKATGIDTIVKASGVAKMSLYKYFPSKDDLVVAHLQRSKEVMLSFINCGIAGEDKTAEQKLLAVFDVFAEILANPEFRGCPFINASAEFADAPAPVRQAVANFSEALHKLLADLALQAGIADAQQLARQLSMLITGAVVSKQIEKQPDTMRTAYIAAKILIEQGAKTRI
ncbi:MAG: TetR/AcrR family transcriptional regulator [Methylococcales bacterium]|nr:TetR/AcrR family transcriptional regulator [Methylococcales bacterium]